ncbi:MAG: class I SAM-dependent methyltransferase [Candidatus Heimdallarchaeota archaeon]
MHRWKRRRHFERAGKLISIAQNCSTILDVGCGYGDLLLEFCARGRDTVGIDIDGRRVSIAKINFDKGSLRGGFIRCDAHFLPFKNKGFDFSFCNQVIEHVMMPEVVVDEMHRVANQTAVMYANDKTPYYYLKSLVLRRPLERIPKITRKFNETHYLNFAIPMNKIIADAIARLPIIRDLLATIIVKVNR